MRTLLTLGAMLVLASAACAQTGTGAPGVATAQENGTTASASPGAKPSQDPDAALKFSRCMREQGIAWFPDPDANGRMVMTVPRGQDPMKLDAARKVCGKLLPDGGEKRRPSQQDLERMRQYARCMRENGLPDFPDPNPDGSIRLNRDKVRVGPGDPAFDKAERACWGHRSENGGETLP